LDRTCFWAGDTFAPKLLVQNAKGEEVPVQQFLQNAFLDMFDQVAAAVAGFEAVIGFEVGFLLPNVQEINLTTKTDHE
jgi:hypothetical protein